MKSWMTINYSYMVRKATNYKPVEETLSEVLLRLKHLEKGQQDIKSHLWSEPSTKSTRPITYDNHIKQEAINYINNVVMPDLLNAEKEQPQGEIAVAGLGDWLVAQLARPIFEMLKAQLLEYIGEALVELKKKAVPYAVKVADWLLDKLEDYIVNKYKETTELQQEQFKEAILEYFPNSRLLGKLN